MNRGQVLAVDFENKKLLKSIQQKTDFVRTSMKKSIRTYTYKLLNKAEANINAVAEGKFGLGVYRAGDKE